MTAPQPTKTQDAKSTPGESTRSATARVETVSELWRVWQQVARALRRDVSAASRLATDPAGTLRELGYDVRREALVALRAALVV